MHTKKASALVVLLICAATSLNVNAAILNSGDVLTINSGIPVFHMPDEIQVDINLGGSWFGLNLNGNKTIDGGEKGALAQGSMGIVIGVTTNPGAAHLGLPTAADSNAITAPWEYFFNTGSDYVSSPINGGSAGLDLSGWNVVWANIPNPFPLGTGAWGAGFTDGLANFNWNGVYGTAYTLDYHATIPLGHSSGFGGLQYGLHLEGIVEAATVPEPGSLVLVGLGMLGLGAFRYRKSQ